MDPSKSKMSVREPREVVFSYSDAQDEIKYLLSKSPVNSPLRSKLECLGKTLCSMEPMVYDMEQSESLQASHRHKYTREFLSLVKEAKIPLGKLLELQAQADSSRDVYVYCLKKLLNIYYLRKLETPTKELKILYQNYVKEELRELLADVGGEPDEMTLKRLVRYLSSTIRTQSPNDYTSIPVLRNMVIILDTLEQESDKRAQLFLLLKQVKLLLRFLNGHHGLDIPSLLLIRERELRKHFVAKGVLARLKNLDAGLQRQKTKMGQTWFMLIVSGYAIASSCPPQRPIYFLIIAFAAYQFFKALSELINGPPSSSNSTNSNGQTILTRKNYEIFLNFSGSDVYPLAALLHSNLEKANVCTFLNETSIRKSERIEDAVEHAISTSIGAIIIFSKNYSESENFLDELVLIHERIKTHKGYTIRPIFYDVEPGDLTKPGTMFDLRFRKHRYAHKIRLENWKEALAYVVSICGHVHDSKGDHLEELVDKVVADTNFVCEDQRGIENNLLVTAHRRLWQSR